MDSYMSLLNSSVNYAEFVASFEEIRNKNYDFTSDEIQFTLIGLGADFFAPKHENANGLNLEFRALFVRAMFHLHFYWKSILPNSLKTIHHSDTMILLRELLMCPGNKTRKELDDMIFSFDVKSPSLPGYVKLN